MAVEQRLVPDAQTLCFQYYSRFHADDAYLDCPATDFRYHHRVNNTTVALISSPYQQNFGFGKKNSHKCTQEWHCVLLITCGYKVSLAKLNDQQLYSWRTDIRMGSGVRLHRASRANAKSPWHLQCPQGR